MKNIIKKIASMLALTCCTIFLTYNEVNSGSIILWEAIGSTNDGACTLTVS